MSGLLYMMLFTCFFFFNGIKIGTSLVNGNMEMHSAYNLGYIYIYIAIVARIYLIWHI